MTAFVESQTISSRDIIVPRQEMRLDAGQSLVGEAPRTYLLNDKMVAQSTLKSKGNNLVHHGYDLKTGEAVALKFYRPKNLRNAEGNFDISNVLTEAQLRRQGQPYVLPVLNVFMSAKHPYVKEFPDALPVQVMPLRKESLNLKTVIEHLPHEPIPKHKIMRYLKQLAEVIDYHADQFVFIKDNKPDNIFLNLETDQIELTDFEEANVMSHWVEKNHVRVTPLYASPEQAFGQHRGRQTEIYTWGLIAYELLTGVAHHQFYDAGSAQKMLENIAYSNGLHPSAIEILYQATRKHRVTRPTQVRSVLERTLKEHAHTRPQRAMDAAVQLEQALI